MMRMLGAAFLVMSLLTAGLMWPSQVQDSIMPQFTEAFTQPQLWNGHIWVPAGTSIPVGDTAKFTVEFRIKNVSNQPLAKVQVKESLGSGIELFSPDNPPLPSRGSAGVGQRGKAGPVQINWDIGDLLSGGEALLVFDVRAVASPASGKLDQSPGEYMLCSGATVRWKSGKGRMEKMSYPAQKATLIPADAIVFSSARDGISQIYTINPDGSSLTRLTDSAYPAGSPAWSPDRTRIAFSLFQDGNSDIYVMNRDGSGIVRLTDSPAYESQPAWSPDGSRIAFSSGDFGNSSIYIMNSDGSRVTRFTPEGMWALAPAWSPDGTRIAFSAFSGPLCDFDIYVMNINGASLARLTDSPQFDKSPAWSPDGSKLAFDSGPCNLSGTYDVYVLDLHTGALQNLTNKPRPDEYPSWSRDGTRIVYSSFDPDIGGHYIRIVNADGTGLTNVTSGSPGINFSDVDPDW